MKKKRTALQRAVEHGSISIVQLLIEREANVNPLPPSQIFRLKWHTLPLITASAKGQVEIVEMLLEAGAHRDTKDVQGRTALFHAVDLYHYEVVRLLMAHNANPTAFALPTKAIASEKLQRKQTPLQILEDRDESSDREIFEDLKSYTEQWKASHK